MGIVIYMRSRRRWKRKGARNTVERAPVGRVVGGEVTPAAEWEQIGLEAARIVERLARK